MGRYSASGLVADAVHLGELLARRAHVGRRAEQAERHGGLEPLGPLVGDVEHGRHLVAVFRVEPARREGHLLHHVGVDDAQPLLLPGADEQRAIHLDAVDIDDVLVEAAAPHVVLRAELVVRADPGEGEQQRLDAARGVGHEAVFRGVEHFLGGGLDALCHHVDAFYLGGCGGQFHGEVQHPSGGAQGVAQRLVAQHGEHDDGRVAHLGLDLVVAVAVGAGAGGGAVDVHVGVFDAPVVGVDDVAVHAHFLLGERGRHGQEEEQQEEVSWFHADGARAEVLLNDYTVISLDIEKDNKYLGKLSVIGPKRMNYAKTISTLKYINEKFNSTLKLNKDSKAKGDYSEKRRD